MTQGEEIRVTLRVIDALESLGVSYHLGGSFASSIHGEPRQTRDADLAADLRPELAEPLASMLSPEFYVDLEAIREAILRRSSFNAIHLDTMFKVDVFIPATTPYEAEEFSRHLPVRLLRDSERHVLCLSPEHTVLRKLMWYRLGGEVAEQQLRDVIGVVEVQGDRLDVIYMRRWADEIGVRDLLEDVLKFARG